ncbi:MAG: hypothetical protein KUG78_00205 [Kangiellaceae bacterium]|nr:hypothetical protein [Kangiellaceae bacterium]
MAIKSNRQFRSHVIVWFLLVAGLVLTITGYSIYRSAEVYLVDKFLHRQIMQAETTAAFIDGSIHRTFNSAKSMKSKAYTRYNSALLKSMKADDFNSFIYTVNITKSGDKINYGVIPDISEDINDQSLFFSGSKLVTSERFNQLLTEFHQSKQTSKTVFLKDITNVQKYISFASIFDSRNDVAGVVIVEVSNRQVSSIKGKLLESMLVTISFLFISLLVASIFFARKITGPFEQLTDAIERLIKNDFNFNLSLSGFGGFTYLAKQFNLMLLKLQVSRNELVSTNKAYSRFVPHQVLKLISPTGIKNTSLGDCVEKDMTILFCDIRGFTSLSESMSPSENFAFINRYLKIMVPVINKYGGTIDKYMGDGIMALFPNSADHALQAAVGMMETLEKYNEKLINRNLPTVKIGLGLHTGKMMLGTVGTSSRMDVTVISDTVNAAARIEALTKTFKTPILISEELRIRLEHFDKTNLRFIATCLVQGKSKPVTLYEVFSQDVISIRKEKLENQNVMITAWQHYKKGNTDQALNLYQRLMEKSPSDRALLALIEVVQRGRL